MILDYIKLEEKAENFENIAVYADEHEAYISAKDQEWSAAAINELSKLDIFFNNDGIMPVRLIERGSSNPLIQLGTEDDGTIYFHDTDQCFDIYWARHLIFDLEDAIQAALKRDIVTFRKEVLSDLQRTNHEKTT